MGRHTPLPALRYNRCGNFNCACKRDPTRRHGPYWVWTTKVDGKTVSRWLSEHEAAGTSLLATAVLSIPILVVHAALGHINWTVAGAFSLGAVPTSFLDGRLALRVASSGLRKTFGWFLVGSGLAFVLCRVLGT